MKLEQRNWKQGDRSGEERGWNGGKENRRERVERMQSRRIKMEKEGIIRKEKEEHTMLVR